MASYVIHKAVTADSFDGIKLTTPSDIKVSHTSTKVSITIPKNTSMHLATSTQYFNFNYCAFVVVKFKDKDGKTLSTIPDLSSGTELSKMLTNSGGAVEDTDYYPKKAAFIEFSGNVLLFHKGQSESDGIQYGNSSPWTSHKLASNKTITVKIPDNTASYTIYIAGCTMNTTTYRRYAYDPYYRANYSSNHPYGESNWEIPTWMNTNMGSGTAYVGGNSCKHSHAFLNTDETSTIVSKPLTVGPISFPKQKIEGICKLNRFNIIVPPFKGGENNDIKWQRIHCDIRRDGLFTDDYYPLRAFIKNIRSDWSATARQNTSLHVNAGKTDPVEKYTKEFFASAYSGYTAGAHLYEIDSNGEYTQVAGGQTIDRTETVNVKGTLVDRYYLRVTKDVSIQAMNALQNNGEWSKNTFAKYDMQVPLKVLGPSSATSDLKTNCIYGANWVWIDSVACDSQESLFDEDSKQLVSINTNTKLYQDANGLFRGYFMGNNGKPYGVVLIKESSYQNPEFFNNKPFSKDYFLDTWKYQIDWDNAANNADTHVYIFEEAPSNTTETVFFRLANRSYWSGDLRRTFGLTIDFNSFPRAPRKTGYVSTSVKNGKQKKSEDYSEEQPLKIRTKDILTFNWAEAFGDIRKPEAAEGYRIYLTYLKDGKGPEKQLPLTENEKAGINNTPKRVYTAGDLSYSDLKNSPIKLFGNIENINLGESGSYLYYFDTESDHFSIIPKNFGLASGDIVVCKIFSYINIYKRSKTGDTYDPDSLITRIYSNNPELPNDLKLEGVINKSNNKDYITLLNAQTDTTGTNKYTGTAGEALYSDEYKAFPSTRSFIDGGRPMLDDGYDKAIINGYLRGNGTVWVKISDTGKSDDWIEGTPWVKTNEGWKEADSLHVKTDNSATGWKESE